MSNDKVNFFFSNIYYRVLHIESLSITYTHHNISGKKKSLPITIFTTSTNLGIFGIERKIKNEQY